MKLLKNKRAWRKFLIDDVSYYRSQLAGAEEPKEYPCYGYAVVQSHAYEEQAPVYLYLSDIEKMAVALRKNTGGDLIELTLATLANLRKSVDGNVNNIHNAKA